MFAKFGRRSALLALCLTAIAVPAVHAQGAAGLPEAKDIIARYVKAAGGDSWKKYKSARMKATMELPGMSATMEVVHIIGTGVAQKVILPGMGESRAGFDGSVAWQVTPMTGPQILTGAQADQMKEDADPENGLRTSANIASVETIEKSTMSGQECYKVKVTWKSGRTATDCYSIADGLLIATVSKAATPMGELETTQYMGDYKDFGGVKRPMSMAQEMMGQRVTITVSSWEWDNVDPKEIEPPAEIKALVKKP